MPPISPKWSSSLFAAKISGTGIRCPENPLSNEAFLVDGSHPHGRGHVVQWKGLGCFLIRFWFWPRLANGNKLLKMSRRFSDAGRKAVALSPELSQFGSHRFDNFLSLLMRPFFETSLQNFKIARVPQELLAGMHFTRTFTRPTSKDRLGGFDDVSKLF